MSNTAPLAPEDAARLTDFARACKAAARAVLLYPPAHPAIAATLGRVVQTTSASALGEPMRITVLPDTLLLEGKAPARPDSALGELATLLHDHLVGELTIHPGGDLDAWRNFLLLLGRSAESVRAEGGIARLWTTTAGRHVELREIDYAEVLRERTSGAAAAWEKVIASCLQGSVFDLDEEAIKELLAVTGDPERMTELLATLESRVDPSGGMTAKAAAIMRLLREMIELVSKNQPDELDSVLRNMATAVGQLSPDLLMSLMSHRGGGEEGGPQLVTAVMSRMSERSIAKFVARSVINDGGPTDRLAQAFQSLVRDDDQRLRLLSLAREDVAASPLGSTEGFEHVWNDVSKKLLTSYSDKPFVSDEYARELSAARTRAIEIEEINDDPPERRATWLGSVATTSLRSLDLTLLLDLLRIEQDDQRWATLTPPVVALLEDLLLVGDFDSASQLIGLLVSVSTGEGTSARRQTAITAIDELVAGSMMRHIVSHLATIDNAQFERVKKMCVSLGEVLVRPLAEVLSTEERVRPRERLTAILVAFGSVGRRTIERLKSSPNAAVRRTAIYLMREFGGSEALPDLTELLSDNEPRVQREAVRAILNIGTDPAYEVLEKALATGTEHSRDAIMQAVSLVRDERATPLFIYILRHVDHRRLNAIYLRAIESLGALRDPESVAPLKEALYKGEWWAPRRTAALRSAAAAALARIGTPDAHAVLEEASRSGSRGLRATARAHTQQLRSARAAG